MTAQTNQVPYPDPVSVKRIYYEEEVKRLINSEVLSVISEMKEKSEVKPVKTPVRGELVGQMFVPLEDIEEIENRYKL